MKISYVCQIIYFIFLKQKSIVKIQKQFSHLRRKEITFISKKPRVYHHI